MLVDTSKLKTAIYADFNDRVRRLEYVLSTTPETEENKEKLMSALYAMKYDAVLKVTVVEQLYCQYGLTTEKEN